VEQPQRSQLKQEPQHQPQHQHVQQEYQAKLTQQTLPAPQFSTRAVSNQNLNLPGLLMWTTPLGAKYSTVAPSPPATIHPERLVKAATNPPAQWDDEPPF